jgi:hypothetical protein
MPEPDPRIALTLMFASSDKPSAVATRVGEVVAAEVAAPLIGMNWTAFDLSEDDTEDDEPDWETIAKQRETERDHWQRAADEIGKLYAAAENQRDDARAERDQAYRERAHLVALLAAQHPAVIAPALDLDEPGWWIVYLTIGGHQCSWHISPRDAGLFTHVERVEPDDPRAQWDGHTTEQKYQHITAHTAQLTKGA